MNNSTTVIVPNWVISVGNYAAHNWTTVLGVVVVAILASITVELIKRHGVSTDDKKKLKRVVTWLLSVITTLFTVLGYVLIYATANQSFLQSLPVIGSHTLEALAVAYTLYNLRLNKYYEAFATWATKYTASKQQSLPVVTASDDVQFPTL